MAEDWHSNYTGIQGKITGKSQQFQYLIKIIPAIRELPLIGISAVVAFLVTKKITSRIPPVIGAILILIGNRTYFFASSGFRVSFSEVEPA
jgi:hypothetical protein